MLLKKNFLLSLLILFSFSLCYASEDTVNGRIQDEFEVAQFDGVPQPSVAPTNTARTYYDVSAGKLMLSVNGGAYADISGGGGGIPEAPNDIHYYGRHALGWSSLDALYLTINAIEPIAHFTIDGNGQAISTTTPWNEKVIPYACTITAWYLDGDSSGNIKIDVQTSTVAPYTSYSSIASTDKPLLNSQQANSNTTLSAWTTTVAAGTRIRVLIDGTVTPTVKKVVLTLKGMRS
jgi:hypothetical protein